MTTLLEDITAGMQTSLLADKASLDRRIIETENLLRMYRTQRAELDGPSSGNDFDDTRVVSQSEIQELLADDSQLPDGDGDEVPEPFDFALQ